MGLFVDGLFAIPIGIMYNMIIHKTGEIFNNDLNYKEKLQKNLLIVFGGGIFGLLLGFSVFGNKNKYKNRALRYGLYFGSLMLLGHSLMYNWTMMQNDTKFIIMITTLISLIWYTYSRLNENENKDEGTSNSLLANLLPVTYTSYEQYNDDTENDHDLIM